MIKAFIKNHYVLIILILIHVVTHYTWVFNFDYLTYGDARVYPPQMQPSLIANSGHIYATGLDLGSFELSGGANVIRLVHGVLASLGFFYNISFRVIYMYSYVFLAPLAIYLLASKFVKSKFGVFCAGLVYLFNTYFLILQTAGVTMLLANMWGTFMLLFYYKFFVEKRTIPNFLMLILVSFITSIYEFRIFYIAFTLCSFLVLYKYLFVERKFSDFILHGLTLVYTLLLNSFWFFPVIFSGQLLDNRLFSRGLFGSGYFDILSAFNLFHRFWTGSGIAQFQNQPIPIYMWVIPVALIIGIYKSRRIRFANFFALLTLLGIFLTKQTDIPFPGIYSWLYDNLPGFNAFREASKFYYISAIGFAVVVGLFIDWLWSIKPQLVYQRYLRVLVSFLLVFTFLYNSKPLLTLDFGSLFVPRHIPEEYKIYNDFIINQNEPFRVLWVPSDSKWGYYSNTNPKLSFASLSTVYWEFLTKKDDYVEYPAPANTYSNLLRQDNSDNLLDAHSIKYVVVPIQDFANDDNFYIHFGNDRSFYLSMVSSLDYLREVPLDAGELRVFENTGYKPRVYVTTAREDRSVTVPATEVFYTYISPTEYRVLLTNVSSTVNLNFSERYDRGWLLRVGELSWFDSLRRDNYFVDKNFHYENDYHLNSYEIDPQYFKETYPNDVKVNEDGTVDVELTLYFTPQAYFELGKVVTYFVIAQLGLGLLYWLVKDKVSQRK